ncbi:hypothetical protein DERP_000643 [Dermatophagoides pteronyssinus]|uniref:Uncharacterized protein n=1 Tax=Dermatophagoides pteronyssinus TaxID=6956 RepID=A0ABQ8J0Q9_DERPT|nr:hypothetical protein DERP_000643 [Dermatophagoides pteronyssinus]
MNQILDISCWPVIQEILSEEPNFLSTNLNEKNDQIFICDHGTRAILISNQNNQTKLYLWNAGYRNKLFQLKRSFYGNQGLNQNRQQQQQRRWFLLNDLCFRCSIQQIRFFDGWLFILTDNDRLHCRNLDANINYENWNKLKSCNDNDNEVDSLYPFGQCLHLKPSSTTLTLPSSPEGGDDNGGVNHSLLSSAKTSKPNIKTTFVLDQVLKFDQSETYTIILLKNQTTIHIILWLIFLDNSNRQLFEHHIEYSSNPECLKYQDIVVYERGYIILTNQQTLLMEGNFITDIPTEEQPFYSRSTMINLKELQFPIANESKSTTSESSKSLIFERIFACKHQLLLLTNNGMIYCLIFTRNKLIPGTFMNEIPMMKIYSNYKSSNFLSIGMDRKIHLYCPKSFSKIQNFNNDYQIKSIIDQQQKPGPRTSLVVTAFESIPDAYSIFIEQNDMPTLANNGLNNNENITIQRNICNQKSFGFNNPITSDLLISLIDDNQNSDNQNYFLHSTIIEPIMGILKKYFHIYKIQRQNYDKIILKKRNYTLESNYRIMMMKKNFKWKKYFQSIDPTKIWYCPQEQSKQLQCFDYEFLKFSNETNNDKDNVDLMDDDNDDNNLKLSTFSPEIIRSFLKFYYTGIFELSDSYIFDELQSFVLFLEQQQQQKESKIFMDKSLIECFRKNIQNFFHKQQQPKPKQQNSSNAKHPITFNGTKFSFHYQFQKNV